MAGRVHGPAAGAMMGELIQAPQLLVDPAGQDKRVEHRVDPRQLDHLRRIRIRARPHAVKGRLRGTVLSPQPAADARFLHQGDRRQPQILEQPQVCVERLERGRRVITHVVHKLAHMGPVLLFNVRVVVFLVGPPPRELNLLPLAVAIEVMVDELRPVVRIDAPEPKREHLAHRLERLLHAEFPFAQHCSGRDPGRVHVGEVQRMDEFAVGAIAGMRHEVDFGKARRRRRPALGPDRDGMFQQRPRLRAAVDPCAALPFVRRQAPVHLPRTDLAQGRLGRGRQTQPATGPRQPGRQQRLQAHRPRIPGGRPDRAQRRDDLGPVASRPAPAAPAPPSTVPPQQANRRFPVIAGHLTHFIQQPPTRGARRPVIPLPHPLQILSPRLWSHSGSSHPHPPLMGHPIFGAAILRSVIFNVFI